MLSLGIIYARWDGTLYFLFLGILLFVAVFMNTYLRRRILESGR